VAATESTAVASAESAACVTTAAPAAVLSESRMRGNGEQRGEAQCGKKAQRCARVRGAVNMIAIDRAGKCDAGNLAFDCVVFCTAWPVSHLTLLAHWVERRRSNCNCYRYYLLLLRDSSSFDAALHAMVANMAFCSAFGVCRF
jgi:hypothetical protein